MSETLSSRNQYILTAITYYHALSDFIAERGGLEALAVRGERRKIGPLLDRIHENLSKAFATVADLDTTGKKSEKIILDELKEIIKKFWPSGIVYSRFTSLPDAQRLIERQCKAATYTVNNEQNNAQQPQTANKASILINLTASQRLVYRRRKETPADISAEGLRPRDKLQFRRFMHGLNRA